MKRGISKILTYVIRKTLVISKRLKFPSDGLTDIYISIYTNFIAPRERLNCVFTNKTKIKID